MERMTGRCVDNLAGDRGYRGINQVMATKILIPESPKPKDGYYQKKRNTNCFASVQE